MFFRNSIYAIALSLPVIAGNAAAQTVSIGTNPQGSLAYAVGAAISKVAIEKGDVQMRVVPQGGPNVVVPLVNAGELEFSIADSNTSNSAIEGIPPGKSRPSGGCGAAGPLQRLHGAS